MQNISMTTASTKEYGVRAEDSHWGIVFSSHVDCPESPRCGPWVWLTLQSALITVFTELPGTVALGLAVCSCIFRFFTVVFPRHGAAFLFTPAPTHTVSSHPDGLPFSSPPLPLPTPCPMKRILFPSSNRSLPIFICSSQFLLCANSSIMYQGGTSQ